jgi:Fe-S-cluster-containing hydrogenase component 2
MPKRNIAIDYQQCDPKSCPDGICQAALLCERKVLYQKTPFELPDANSGMCLGCSLCLNACPRSALRMM